MPARIDAQGNLIATAARGHATAAIPTALVPVLRAFFAAEERTPLTVDELADEIPQVTIGSGYYSTTIGALEAREIAEDLVARLLVYPLDAAPAGPAAHDAAWRAGFSAGWYASRAEPEIVAATHSPRFVPPVTVPA